MESRGDRRIPRGFRLSGSGESWRGTPQEGGVPASVPRNLQERDVMRASTLFVATLALLIGLGIAVAAKYTNLFSRPVAEALPEIQVVVTARNVFAGDLIDTSWVRVRALRPEEREHYLAHREQYLPPVVEAAALRVANRNIEADQPILRDHLTDLSKPESIHQRLLPTMRAVNVAVPKERSAGGLIQVGEWVDVHLTTTIEESRGDEVATRTAPIARNVRVIAKRNALWNIFAALPDDKPVNFTLEVNPYRAALLEFSRAKGYLTLVPVSAAEMARLEREREEMLQVNQIDDPSSVHFGVPTAEERARVQAIIQGQLTVSDTDLMRIFGLSTPPPPEAPVAIEEFRGATFEAVRTFSSEGRLLEVSEPGRDRARPSSPATRRQTGQSMSSLRFTVPEDCPTCGKNKNNAGR